MEKDEITRGLEQAVDVLAYNFTGHRFDHEMRQVTEEYKQEMIQWLTEGVAVAENPMKRGTQEHWYSLYLEKKRLENHRCKVQYTQYKHVPYNPTEAADTVYTYRKDGKYMVCQASQMTSIEKNYIRDGVIIGKEKQTRDVTYYILRSQNEEGLYICPNCGVEQSLDELLDGCDYCKTKFDISAYDDKVMSVMKNKTTFDTREGNISSIMGGGVLAAFGIVGVIFGLMGALFTLGLSLIFVPIGALLVYLGFKGAIDSNKGVTQNTNWKNQIKEKNQDFSEEEFIGSLDCKLKSIHYASTPQELAAFVKCDIAPFVKSYQNIINCEIGKISFKNYRVEGDFQYLDIHREIEVLQDCDTHLQPAKGVVGVTLAKRISYKLKNDVTLYRCDGCGASISLVEGGKCTYCGNEMDYAAYDWIVVGYKHVKAL